MTDGLIRQNDSIPAVPQMTVTASGEGTAIGAVYGNVNLGITPELLAQALRMAGEQAESHAAEWALLNTERYNVFVLENEKYDCGAFYIGRRVALAKNTLPEHRDYYKPLTPTLVQEIMNMPCLFAIRNPSFKKAPVHYPALVGKLTEVTCQGETIKCKFVTCGKLPQQFINDNIRIFGLLSSTVRNQLDEEQWSIRSGNLLQIADSIGVEIK